MSALCVPVNSSNCCSCTGFFFLASLLNRASVEGVTRRRTRSPRSRARGRRKEREAMRLMIEILLCRLDSDSDDEGCLSERV